MKPLVGTRIQGSGLEIGIAKYTLHAGVIEAVIAHARAAAPAECCGLLLGGAMEIVEAIPAGNLSEDPNRFLIDPRDHFDARRKASAQGLALVGFYHSHPHSPAAPSTRDVAESAYPDAVHLIVSLASEPPDVRLFRFDSAGYSEMRIRD